MAQQMSRWSGRVALVTGASSGIGAEICRELVKHGMKVIGCARRVERVQEISKELVGQPGVLIAIKCDLTQESNITEMFQAIKEEHGGVDVCINNAGDAKYETLLEGTWSSWDYIMKLNVIAPSLCLKLSIQSMRERGVDDGHVININSIAGHVILNMSRKFDFYTASKHALTVITESVRRELRDAKSNIRITQLSPGAVDTEMLNRFRSIAEAKMSKQLLEGVQKWQKHKVLGADDLANGVIYALASPPHVEINDMIIRSMADP